MWRYIVLLMLVVHCCHADYLGTVVEYNPLPGPTAALTLEENLKNYIYQIEQAESLQDQIIVFPEYGLTGLVTNPAGYAIPVPPVGTTDFSNETYILLSLSNAAKGHKMFVVVNLLEQVNGTDNTTIYHNTNLVFADNGTLVAKYRKINLFQEPNLTSGNELVTFTTNFGTFGLLTCMDILYYHPSQTVLDNTGVTDIILPTAWTSEVPFYVSLEVQLAYAMANGVNVLAANINDPMNAKGGSSIIRRDGTVMRRILTDTPATNSISARLSQPINADKHFTLAGFDVFRNDTHQPLSDYKNLTVFEYDRYVFKHLDLHVGNITDVICDGSFCCNFNIETLQNGNNNEVYKLVAFNGKVKFNTTDVGVKLCNLVACLKDDVASCGVRPSAPYNTTFRKITVWGNWEARPEEFFRPISLRGNLEPTYNASYLENRTNKTVGVSFNITRPVDNVILFGLYVRNGVESFGVSFGLVAFLITVRCIFS